MNTAHLLDATVTGGFVPYRDSQDRPRLLDTVPPRSGGRRSPEIDAMRKRLRVSFLKALEAGAAVGDEQSFRVWYNDHAEPLLLLTGEARALLGYCVGDEGHEWYCLADQLLGAVRQPGWRVCDSY